jgi:hypothetical protein
MKANQVFAAILIVFVAGLMLAAVPFVSVGTSSSAALTRPADATPYTAGDVMGESPIATYYTFGNVAASENGELTVTQASVQIDTGTITGLGQMRLHLYKAAPTAQLDNAVFNIPAADRSNYLGYIAIESAVTFGDTAYMIKDSSFRARLSAGAKTLYGVLQTAAGFTPATGTKQTVVIHTQE